MAFALIIVYAGAILITYMFVLMLAQQAPDPEHPSAQPAYDRLPREPMAAVVAGPDPESAANSMHAKTVTSPIEPR